MDEVDLNIDIQIDIGNIIRLIDVGMVFGSIIFRSLLEESDVELIAEGNSYWNDAPDFN